MDVNYDTLDRDIALVERVHGTYDMDYGNYYEAHDNVMAYVKEQRELDKG